MAKVGTAEVKCRSCAKEVEVEITEFGKGFVAECPECCGVAYNSKEPPAGMTREQE